MAPLLLSLTLKYTRRLLCYGALSNKALFSSENCKLVIIEFKCYWKWEGTCNSRPFKNRFKWMTSKFPLKNVCMPTRDTGWPKHVLPCPTKGQRMLFLAPCMSQEWANWYKVGTHIWREYCLLGIGTRDPRSEWAFFLHRFFFWNRKSFSIQ